MRHQRVVLVRQVREPEADRAAVVGLHVGEESDVHVVERRVTRTADDPADDAGGKAERDDQRHHLPASWTHRPSLAPGTPSTRSRGGFGTSNQRGKTQAEADILARFDRRWTTHRSGETWAQAHVFSWSGAVRPAKV